MKRRLFISKISLAASGLSLGASALAVAAKPALKIADVSEIAEFDFQRLIGRTIDVWTPSGEKGKVMLKEIFLGTPNSFRTPFTLNFELQSKFTVDEGLCKMVHPDKGLLDVYLMKKKYPDGNEVIEVAWN